MKVSNEMYTVSREIRGILEVYLFSLLQGAFSHQMPNYPAPNSHVSRPVLLASLSSLACDVPRLLWAALTVVFLFVFRCTHWLTGSKPNISTPACTPAFPRASLLQCPTPPRSQIASHRLRPHNPRCFRHIPTSTWTASCTVASLVTQVSALLLHTCLSPAVSELGGPEVNKGLRRIVMQVTWRGSVRYLWVDY